MKTVPVFARLADQFDLALHSQTRRIRHAQAQLSRIALGCSNQGKEKNDQQPLQHRAVDSLLRSIECVQQAYQRLSSATDPLVTTLWEDIRRIKQQGAIDPVPFPVDYDSAATQSPKPVQNLFDTPELF